MPETAVDRFRRWKAHPAQFVRDVFGVVPDAWQEEVLEAFPHHAAALQCAPARGREKPALLAWLAWNFLLTRPHPKIPATSISGDNLHDNLWAEMAKWQQRSPLLTQLFEWQKTRIVSRERPETWWMSARSWPT